MFYNSISDITIFDVSLTSDVMYNNSDNCTRIITHVTTVITVKETGNGLNSCTLQNGKMSNF